MQVGLVIGDVESVMKRAELRRHTKKVIMQLHYEQLVIHDEPEHMSPFILIQIELVLEFEEILTPFLRTRLRTGHKVVCPMQMYNNGAIEALEQIFERKATYRADKHRENESLELQVLQCL